MMPFSVHRFRLVILPMVLVAGLLPLLQAHAGGAPLAKGVQTSAERPPAAASGKADDIDRLIASARVSVKENPTDVQPLIRLGELLINKGDLDEALSCFDKALAMNPLAHDAKTGRGIVFFRKGDLRQAEQILREALRLNPNPVKTHYELGLVYEKLGDLEKSVVEFKEGIRKHEQGR